MHFLTLLAITLSAATAAPTPSASTTSSAYKYRLQAKTIGANSNVDSDVNNYYIAETNGPIRGSTLLLVKEDNQEGFDGIAKEVHYKLNSSPSTIYLDNGKSIVLTPLESGYHSEPVHFSRGRNHNQLLPYRVNGKKCFKGSNKDFSHWVACTSQYGVFLDWADKSYVLDTTSPTPFQCTFVLLCQA